MWIMNIAACAFSLSLASATLLAGNWPEWRGPTRDGVVHGQNLPLQWSATENVRWKTPLPGPGNSTPIVWGGQVFITQALEQEGRRTLMSFDRKSGKLLWQSGTLFAEKEESHETNPQCASSPATDGERIIAWFGTAGLFCYDLNGKELWQRNLGRHRHRWGYAGSPIIHGDHVFLNFGPGENSFLVALDKKTGQEIWRKDIEEQHRRDRRDGFANQGDGVTGAWSVPIIVNAGGRDELVMTVPDAMLGLDPKTGQELWRCRGLNPLVYTSPVASGGIIIGSGGFTGPDLVVKAGGQGDVTATHKLWESAGRTANRLGSSVIKDGHVYIATMSGIAECLDLKTGQKVWEERLKGKGPKSDIWSSLILSGDRIYVLNQSGDTVVFRASPKFEILQVNSFGNEMCNGSIVASDGDLFIRTYENLYCITGTASTAGLQ